MANENRLAVLELLHQLHVVRSWSGETHVQKVGFFLKELYGIPFGFDYLLYKHGPYSFDLHDELLALRADGLVDLVVNPSPYGPSLQLTGRGEEFRSSHQRREESVSEKIHEAAEALGRKSVADLERLATALFVSSGKWSFSQELRARELSTLKPHISLERSLDAVIAVDKLHSVGY